MSDDAANPPPLAPEVQLMEEILSSPDLQHDVKGRRTRDTLRFLFQLYQRDPNATATEDEVATVVYGGPELDREDSAVRKAISRARQRLKRFRASQHTSRALRVEIPEGEYRLIFTREFLRYGVEPRQWFWSEYLNGSQPVVMGFIPPERDTPREARAVMFPERVLSLYQAARELMGPQPERDYMGLPEWGNVEILLTPKHKLLFGIVPANPIHIEVMWKRRGDLRPIVMYRDPTEKTIISDPSPPPTAPTLYVDGFNRGYVLFTRFTVPKTKTQITSIVAHHPQLLEKMMKTLTSNERLFPVVTTGALGNDSLDVERAPSIFQLVFEMSMAHHFVINANPHAKLRLGEPHLRLASVFGKELSEGILVNKRDSSSSESRAETFEPSSAPPADDTRDSSVLPPIPPDPPREFKGTRIRIPPTPSEDPD